MKSAARLGAFAIVFAASAVRAETSAMTDAFAAATTSAFAVLQQSDALALAGGSGSRLQAFAARDSAAQAEAADTLVTWANAQRRADKLAAEAPTIDGLGRLLYPFDATVLPLHVGGRSAIAADRAVLERLDALRGSAFDAVYAPSQAGALGRLQEAYTDYIKNGDDPALRRLAVQNLPRVRHLLAELFRR